MMRVNFNERREIKKVSTYFGYGRYRFVSFKLRCVGTVLAMTRY